MTEAKKNKVNEIMATEEFVEKFKDVIGVTEAVALFKELGADITEADFEEIMDSIPDEEELDDKALEGVAGGGALDNINVFAKAAKTIDVILKCNKYTKWGTNGKHCICGYHFF